MFAEQVATMVNTVISKIDEEIENITEQLSNPPSSDDWEAMENWRAQVSELRNKLNELRSQRQLISQNSGRLINAVKAIENSFVAEIGDGQILQDATKLRFAWTLFNDIINQQNINDIAYLEARASEIGKQLADKFKEAFNLKVGEPTHPPAPSYQTVPAAPVVSTAFSGSLPSSSSSSEGYPRTATGEIDWEKVDVVPADEMKDERARYMGERYIQVRRERNIEARYHPYRRESGR